MTVVPERVLVGFSGGVDSAMAALLLREQGHAVHAVHMAVRDELGRGCGHPGDAEAARALAGQLGIPFTAIDCSSPYQSRVLAHFQREYIAGRTPNPCVVCNPVIKFTVLPDLAREAGIAFDRFATGHYARIEYRTDLDRHVLLRGTDPGKDQSYFLYRLSPEQLAMTLFPLGGMTKREIRAGALARSIPVHDKPDSQDFYAGDYAELLGREAAEGEIVRLDGSVVGRHDGYWHFTPGQRKGLGVAFREPLYVVRVEPEANRVVVGTKEEQLRRSCRIGDLCFAGSIPDHGTILQGKLRSAQPLKTMSIGERSGETLEILFGEPHHGVAPGQSLVLYDGEMVVGGGVITA